MIEIGYCQCGCGQKTKLAPFSHKTLGWVRGQPILFIKGHNARKDYGDRFWSKVDIKGRDECWLWKPKPNWAGYGSFDGHNASNVAYTLTKGKLPKGMIVRHTCDNPPCCNPNHLIPGTRSDNTRDMLERGRDNKIDRARGTDCHFSKFKDNDILEMRAMRKNHSLREIASKFNTTESNVSDVVRYKTWKHLP